MAAFLLIRPPVCYNCQGVFGLCEWFSDQGAVCSALAIAHRTGELGGCVELRLEIAVADVLADLLEFLDVGGLRLAQWARH